jgi:hypothetical protein
MKHYYLLLLVIVFLQSHAQAQQFSLGTAQSFGVLGGSTVTNTGVTVITGNVGVSPGSAITGFPPGGVTPPGTIHAGDAVALQAQQDVTTSYNALNGLAPTKDLTDQDLGGLTLLPGVYDFSSSAQLTGTLTLNGLGNSDALFVIRTGSTLTTASNSSIVLVNGADGCNVFFTVGSSATLGTGTAFEGNILALTSISLNTMATINDGRALAQNGAVTLDTNIIRPAGCSFMTGPVGTFSAPTATSVPEPSSVASMGLGGVGLLGLLLRARKRRHSA